MYLEARQYGSGYCRDRFGRVYRCRTPWNSWGRWVATGVIIVAFILLIFICSCISARRRRKAGRQPFYGTGWAAKTGHGQATYNPQYQTQQSNYQSPPNYNQTSGGYYSGNQGNQGYGNDNYGNNNYGGGAAQGYYGGQQTSPEVSAPQNSYRGGDNVYQPPSGPPPNKVS